MDFLNKLYESNYFGIGLFAVISFLVVTFLIVLFFGKKDEQKRKQESMLNQEEKNLNAFKETGNISPIEIAKEPINSPIEPTVPIPPVAPINYDNTPITPERVEIAPETRYEDVNITPIKTEESIINPVTPMVNEPVVPIIREEKPIQPEVVTPIINEPIRHIISEPEVVEEPVISRENEHEYHDYYDYNKEVEPVTPKVMEPIKITIPEEEPIREARRVEPIIKEKVEPIITPTYEEKQPVIEEPVINESYYKPVEEIKKENIKVPNIDFDAIAESISKELDELEKTTTNNRYEEVKVTPMSEITPKPSANQFSSVYVHKEASAPMPKEPTFDLPKRIDLPKRRDE